MAEKEGFLYIGPDADNSRNKARVKAAQSEVADGDTIGLGFSQICDIA